MDPNKTYTEIQELMAQLETGAYALDEIDDLQDDVGQLTDKLESLFDWLERGGFPPAGWTKHSLWVREAEQALIDSLNRERLWEATERMHTEGPEAHPPYNLQHARALSKVTRARAHITARGGRQEERPEEQTYNIEHGIPGRVE